MKCKINKFLHSNSQSITTEWHIQICQPEISDANFDSIGYLATPLFFKPYKKKFIEVIFGENFIVSTLKCVRACRQWIIFGVLKNSWDYDNLYFFQMNNSSQQRKQGKVLTLSFSSPRNVFKLCIKENTHPMKGVQVKSK